MPLSRLVPLLAAALLVSLPARTQQPSVSNSPAPQRDPQAVSAIQDSLRAMGAASLAAIQDTEIQAQVSSPNGDASVTSTVTLRTLGTRFLRVDASSADGTAVSTMNDTEAWMKVGTGDAEFVPLQSIGAGGITQVPLLSILSDWNLPGMRIGYVGLEKLDTSTVHHVRVTPALEDGLPRELESPCEIYIDQQSLFVLKLIYPVRPPADLKQIVLMEVGYQDYKVVSGIVVPHRIAYTIHGQLIEEYKISSFTVNRGIQKSEFALR